MLLNFFLIAHSACVNAVKPDSTDDTVKPLLKTCSNWCRDINGNLELDACVILNCVFYIYSLHLHINLSIKNCFQIKRFTYSLTKA